MEITREDVLRCAQLTGLRLQEDEIEPLRQDMARLLTQAERLDELPLEGIEPTSPCLPQALPRRPDEARPWFTQEEALANAPQKAQGQFVVPRVL
jgi:aspartyl-tRNA(Asn)/glutamyl-tRNA(Gln) amidotransferase subunit C